MKVYRSPHNTTFASNNHARVLFLQTRRGARRWGLHRWGLHRWGGWRGPKSGYELLCGRFAVCMYF